MPASRINGTTQAAAIEKASITRAVTDGCSLPAARYRGHREPSQNAITSRCRVISTAAARRWGVVEVWPTRVKDVVDRSVPSRAKRSVALGRDAAVGADTPVGDGAAMAANVGVVYCGGRAAAHRPAATSANPRTRTPNAAPV